MAQDQLCQLQRQQKLRKRAQYLRRQTRLEQHNRKLQQQMQQQLQQQQQQQSDGPVATIGLRRKGRAASAALVEGIETEDGVNALSELDCNIGACVRRCLVELSSRCGRRIAE